jgi:exopolyphosphatase/guanosine-5'-triphosphate,3'-diphosphate pyrophosphatase
MRRIAIIDLGTNTFHLLIAQINGDELRVLHKEKQSVKIGEKGISMGEIAGPAQERAIHTLQGFKQTIKGQEVEEVYATATSAFRNARNGQELAKKIFHETSIHIEIIDGEREAQLIYQGVQQALDLGTSNSLIMDIGGGSVEFIIADHNGVKWMHSYEIGAQRLMDKFHHHDPIDPEEILRLEAYLDTELTTLVSAVEQHQPRVLIGASGTFDTLSNIFCIKEGITMTGTPEQPLTISGFRQIHELIIHKNRKERLTIPGMMNMRVDMIVVASGLIDFLLNKLHFEELRVSTFALKEGLLYEVNERLRPGS